MSLTQMKGALKEDAAKSDEMEATRKFLMR